MTMKTRVDTRYGQENNAVPVTFWMNDQLYTVMEIEDRWYGPHSLWFKVFASDARHYLLRQILATASWEVLPMNAVNPRGAR
jgi:hypothetical protein